MKKTLFLLFILITTKTTIAQKIKIGVNHNPPYISIHVTTKDTIYSGIVVDMLSRSTSRPYQLIYCPSKEDAIHKLANNQIDLVANASMNFDRLSRFNATTPYMHSEIGICIKKYNTLTGANLIWHNIVKLRWSIISVMIALLLAYIVLGLITYLPDLILGRISHKEKFDRKKWAIYGYRMFEACFTAEDRITNSLFGKFLMIFVIMGFQIIVNPLIINSFGYELQKSNEQNYAFSKISDLKKHKVLVLKGTSNEDLLRASNINYVVVNKVEDALKKCSTDENYIFIHDKATINWYLNKLNLAESLIIPPIVLQINNRVFLYRKNLKNKKIIQDLNLNPLKLAESGELGLINEKYNN
jgi:ABC-type amino acid transport substrate-binding protein